MHLRFPLCEMETVRLLSERSCLNEACLRRGVAAWQLKWGGILCW